MPIYRFYTPEKLEKGAHITLEEDEAHHLLKVSRVRPGEDVELVNGKNVLALGRLKNTTIEILDVATFPPPTHEIILAQAMPRINRLDLILEKATELGMTTLLLFPGEKSERTIISETQEKRMKRIVINAMKQCGRLDLPKIIAMPPLLEWKEMPPHAYFGDISPDAPLFSQAWKKEKATTIFIGPESGFSDGEIKFLRKHGVKGVKLHPYILRTDTAPLMALSLIAHWVAH